MGKNLLRTIQTSLAILFFSVKLFAQADDLMLVEYVDWQPGSGVGVKIYNPTNASINLASYDLEVYNNGNTSPNGVYALTGNLVAKSTIIVGNSPYCTSNCSSTCDITNSNAGVNGNDVVVLRKGTTIIDMIGLLGYDPGSSGWRVDNTTNALKWHKVTRNSNNCTRYTSITGSGVNSWPNSSGTNVTGWTVSNYSCINQNFVLNVNTTVPKINIPSKDTVVCGGQSLSFAANGFHKWLRRRGGTETTISNNDSVLNINFTTSGTDTIIVQAVSCGVVIEDTVVVTVGIPFNTDLGNDTTICGTINLLLNPNISGANYTWQDNSTQPTYTAQDTGLYWVNITKDGCKDSDSVRIDAQIANTFNFGADTTLCTGDSIILSHTCTGCTYVWSDSSTNDSLTVKQSGTYWLSADDGICTTEDTIVITFTTPPNVDLGKDTTLCGVDSIILSSPANVTRLWDDSSTDSLRVVKTSGIYWLEASSGSCVARDSIQITFVGKQVVNLGNDTAICSGDSLVLNYTCAGCTYVWSDNSTNDSLVAKQSGTYWLEVTNSSCKNRDSINLSSNPKPQLNLGVDTSLCSGDSIILNSPVNVTRLWENTSMDSSRTIKTTGSYRLTITDGNNCKNTDTINITFNPIPFFSLGADTSLCANSSITLRKPIGTPGQVLWSTGSTTDSITISTANTYWARVNQNNCRYTDSIEVLAAPVYTEKLVDTSICAGQTIILDATTQGASYLWNDGSTFNSLVADTTGKYSVTVTISGCNFFDSAFVRLDSIPQSPNLRDTTVCEDATLNLNSTTNATSYLWSNGVTTPTLAIDSAGVYVVQATNKCGFITDTANVIVEICDAPFIPNVFTPNGDGINDFFFINFNVVKNFKVEVFNRWGERVFESEDPKFSWDGKYRGELVPAGVYFYLVTSKIGIGKTFNAKGSLTIYR